MCTGSYKAKLIGKNPKVALLIDNRCRRSDPGSVTALGIHGTAGFVTAYTEKIEIVEAFRKHRPHLAELLGHPDTGIVSVTPRSFQLFDGVDKGYFLKRGGVGWVLE